MAVMDSEDVHVTVDGLRRSDQVDCRFRLCKDHLRFTVSKRHDLLVIGMGICIHLLCTGWYCLPPLSAALNGLHVPPCPVQ